MTGNQQTTAMHDVSGNEMMVASSRLRLARLKYGLTLDQVARASGVTPSHLSRIERGEKIPSVGTLMRLAKALHTNVGELLGSGPEQGEFVIVRAKKSAQRSTPAQLPARYDLLLQEASCNGSSITAFIAKPEQGGGASETTCHQGSELLFVLSGSIKVAFCDRHLQLDTGDLMLFPGFLQHQLQSVPGAAATVLVVVIGR